MRLSDSESDFCDASLPVFPQFQDGRPEGYLLVKLLAVTGRAATVSTFIATANSFLASRLGFANQEVGDIDCFAFEVDELNELLDEELEFELTVSTRRLLRAPRSRRW